MRGWKQRRRALERVKMLPQTMAARQGSLPRMMAARQGNLPRTRPRRSFRLGADKAGVPNSLRAFAPQVTRQISAADDLAAAAAAAAAISACRALGEVVHAPCGGVSCAQKQSAAMRVAPCTGSSLEGCASRLRLRSDRRSTPAAVVNAANTCPTPMLLCSL